MSINYTYPIPPKSFISMDKELNEAVNEELGISKDVENAVKSVSEIIKDYIEKYPVDYSKNDFFFEDATLPISLFGENMKLFLKIYFFKDYNSWRKNYGIIRELYQYVNGKKEIIITIVVVNRDIISNTFSTKLAHKIRHALQYNKTKKRLLHSSKYYQNVYDKTGSQINGIVGEIIYLSSKYEQEAYGEEMYNELMYSSEPIDFVYKSCNGWAAYERLKKLIKILEANRNNAYLANDISKRGYSFDKFLKKVNNAKHRFLKRLARAIVQVKKDRIDFVEK